MVEHSPQILASEEKSYQQAHVANESCVKLTPLVVIHSNTLCKL